MNPAQGPDQSAGRPSWVVAGGCLARGPRPGRRACQTEAGPGDVLEWHELARHLVQAHGGNPGSLISNRITLDQLRFAHADTHLALALISARPPDGHAHSGRLDPGDPMPRLLSYFPFWSAPHAARNGRTGTRFPVPAQTGLPHTAAHPRDEAEEADWAAGRVPRRLSCPVGRDADWAHLAGTLGVTEATRGDWITAHAGRASASWRARTSSGPAIHRGPRGAAAGSTATQPGP